MATYTELALRELEIKEQLATGLISEAEFMGFRLEIATIRSNKRTSNDKEE